MHVDAIEAVVVENVPLFQTYLTGLRAICTLRAGESGTVDEMSAKDVWSLFINYYVHACVGEVLRIWNESLDPTSTHGTLTEITMRKQMGK